MSRFSRAARKVTSNPVRALAAVGTGGLSEVGLHALGALGPPNVNVPNLDPGTAGLEGLAQQEEAKRKALGVQQQGQINTFADEQQKRATDFRGQLAKSLADTSANTFKQMNPSILEDLNSRGLFTSQTARDQEQGRVLGELANNQNQQLSAFDTATFNDLNDIRGTGLSALLGGDQAALDSALALRKAGFQRSFDVADQNASNSMAKQLAKRQSYDSLISSLIGGGSKIGSAFLGK